MTPEQEQQYHEEAERLALLPREDQRQLIAQHWAIAGDTDVPREDRTEAKERAEALEKHLRRLARKKKESL